MQFAINTLSLLPCSLVFGSAPMVSFSSPICLWICSWRKISSSRCDLETMTNANIKYIWYQLYLNYNDLEFCLSNMILSFKFIFINTFTASVCLVKKKPTWFDFPGLLINYLFQKVVLSRAPLNTGCLRFCEHGVQVSLHHEPELVQIGELSHCQCSYLY